MSKGTHVGQIDWTNVFMGIGATIFGGGFWKWASVVTSIKDDLLKEIGRIYDKVEEVDEKVANLRSHHGERIAAVEAKVNGKPR